MATFHFELTDDDRSNKLLFYQNGDNKTDIACWACNERIIHGAFSYSLYDLVIKLITHVCK